MYAFFLLYNVFASQIINSNMLFDVFTSMSFKLKLDFQKKFMEYRVCMYSNFETELPGRDVGKGTLQWT